MKRISTFSIAAALAVAFGFAGTAKANHVSSPARYADSVTDFGVTGNSVAATPHGDETNTLGKEDGSCCNGWFSLGTGFDDEGGGTEGFFVVQFDDNVLIPDGTGADDLTIWEAHSFPGNDEADVYVSTDDVTYHFVGTAFDNPVASNSTFPNSFDVDGIVPFVKFVKLVNQGGSGGAKGFDLDAVEALSSVEAMHDDGCADADPDGRDISMITAMSNGTKITVTLALCADAFTNTKYRVHFDYKDGLATVADRNDDQVVDGADVCFTTSDDTMKLHRNRDTGPGMINDTSPQLLVYMVDYSELGVLSGDLVEIWADVQWKGIVDRAPNTFENGTTDTCSKPENAGEIIAIVLSD